jgi:glycosyltransferase involved in cell wall biosynthesis
VRVLYVIDSLRGGGAETSLVDVIPPLRAIGVDVVPVVLLPDDGALRERLTARGIEVRLITARDPFRSAWSLARLIRANRPDLVHTTLLRADVLGRVVARACGVPVVTSLVNDSYGAAHRRNSRYGSWTVVAVWLVDRSTARLAVRFHAVSSAVAGTMASRLGIRRDRIDVVLRGRDGRRLGSRSVQRREATRRDLGIDETTPIVLVVARQDRQKGIDVAIRAIQLLRERRPDALLLVAGAEGNATPILQDLRARDRDAVRFLGQRDDVADLMCAADVLALPSRWEGLAGTLIEALALEVGVVATDIAPIREVLGGCGCALVPVENAVALATALDRVLTGGEEVDRQIAAGRQRYLDTLGIEAAAAGMAAFYRRALERHGEERSA